ncbi:MAG TPA: hypothetical protein PLH64_04465 [Anaerolineaceae bacterium]|nr:hypothetical protein [Anaerolineaceae bacterium]
MTALLLLTSLLTACQYQTTLPGRSEVPIYKPPQFVTSTPAPTPTPQPPDYIQTGSPVQVQAGMFSFEPVTTWDESGVPLALQIRDTRVTLSNAEESLFFSLASEPALSGSTTQICVDTILQRMAADLSDLQYSEASPITIQNGTGLQVQLQTKVFSQTSIGTLQVIQVNQRCFSLLGLATSEDTAALWEKSGVEIFNQLQQSVRFLEPSQLMYCEVAMDASYGTSPENPIRTGNTNLYDGLTRQENYLFTLRGPNFEEVFFSRLSPEFNDLGVIVDPYRIEYTGIPEAITLYFDMNTYEPLFAPQDFTCEAAFPISAP